MKIVTLPRQDCPASLLPTDFTSTTLVMEHRIVWNLLQYLAANGYAVSHGNDGEERHDINTPEQAMEVYSSVDESAITFTNPESTFNPHSVWFVGGNGDAVIMDYNCKDPVFTELMDKFDEQLFV